MESKFDQLTKLKQLLDSGALTQEEFDAAKKRILDSDNAPEASVKQQASAPSTANTESKQKQKKYIKIAIGIIAIAVIIGLVRNCSGKNGLSQSQAYAVNDSVVTTSVEMSEESVATDDLDDNGNYVDKDDAHYNHWHKSYFKDDFNGYDYSRPYMALWVSGSRNVNLGVLYKPNGIFTLKLFDDDGFVRSITSPTIKLGVRVNGNDIGPSVFTVDHDEIDIAHPDDIKAVSSFFNYGDFMISIEYEDGLGEIQHYVFSVSNPQNEFKQAIDHLLGTKYFGQ